jgi:hypothetical protein
MNDHTRGSAPNPAPGPNDDDLLLRQVRAVLTPTPAVDRRAIAQILAATTGRQRTARERLLSRLAMGLEWWRFSSPPLARGASLAAAALTIGFVARGYVQQSATGVSAPSAQVAQAPVAPSATPLRTPMVAAEGTADPSAMKLPVQFVLDARDAASATQVSVVGDFNDWDVQAAPMVLEQGVWSATVTMPPGRHVYAFVVNGDRWIADPRAARAADADFGRPGSVIIVQTP